MARKSSGCVVYRFNQDGIGELEILLVTNRSGKEWVFPKGGVEPDMTPRDSAVKEVYEEAGVTGIIGPKLGKYRYVKDGVMQKVNMYAMRYSNDTEDWPEQDIRTRQWFPIDRAEKKLNEFLVPFLHDLRKTVLDQ